MSQAQLSGVAVAVAAGVYAVPAVLWRWDRADPAAAAHLDAVAIDPYHALATAGRPDDADRAAAAELLAGLVRVDEEAGLSLTGKGHGPAGGSPPHPVPAALLTALRRHAEPVALYRLHRDGEHGGLRDAFLRAEDAKVPRWSARTEDALHTPATLTVVLLSLWFAVQLVLLRDFSSSGAWSIVLAVLFCFLLWLMLAVPLGRVALRWWPGRHDRFREHCRDLPPHPAEPALDPVRAERLKRSTRDPGWEREARKTWVDSGGAL
ncbi:hypothetical protein GCM10023084_70080 [Streptomyces lacrimifluminis]|uniref:Uncharacterized protein n=1 Tax=Streptomyces lacrimifluminis TaxID=1500077 RepID=A0A917UJ81_9ACTN|nr:hypothetical protein [Streptomyces lacrimifluminis]GGJ61812.1 hypothetical protein GCM10012282_68840 [Streptomyces lacrimifluminis]